MERVAEVWTGSKRTRDREKCGQRKTRRELEKEEISGDEVRKYR